MQWFSRVALGTTLLPSVLGCESTELAVGIDRVGDGPRPDVVQTSEQGTDAGLDREVRALQQFCGDLKAAWVARCKRDGNPRCAETAATLRGARVCRAAERAMAAGRLSFDAARAAECVAAEAFDLARAWHAAWIPPLQCDDIFLATAELGDACYPDESFQRFCVDAACDRRLGCPGTCVAYMFAGEPCLPEYCAPGTFCDGEEVCREEISLGEPCPDGGGCALPGVCRDGSCRLEADLDEECSEELGCAYPYYCSRGSCVTQVGRGDACDSNERCPAALGCAFQPPGGTSRICAALPEADEPCDLRSGCAPGLHCETDGSPLRGSCVVGAVPPPPSGGGAAPTERPDCVGD